MSMSMIMEKQAALVAQCPAPFTLPEDEAVNLPIHVHRTGSGPLVLIIHGGVQGGVGGGPATFAKQNVLADRGWELTMVDRPGFGDSPSRGVDDMERDGVWISDMLGSGGHLIGHSWGGAAALLAAARRPDAVRSLILVEPALQALVMTDPETGDATKATVGRSLGSMMTTAQTPGEYGLAFIRMLGTNDDTTSKMIQSFSPETATRFGCAVLQARMAPPSLLMRAAETVAKAKIPVLLISGGWSDAFEAVSSVTARLTGGRHASVPSSNHLPQLENPEEFNRVVEAFMHESASPR